MSSPDTSAEREDVDIFTLGKTLWADRWKIIGVAAVFAVVSIAYSLLATEWYQAEVVVAPSEKRGGANVSGTIGSLASLAGVSLGGLGGSGQESLAVLKSKGYAREFIEASGSMPALATQRGLFDDKNDIRDAVRIFDDKVRTVEQDRRTGLVTITITWTDGAVAARWANEYVRRLNDRLRNDAIRESQRNLEYLNKEIAAEAVVAVQQSLGRVVESEMQKMLLARSSEEFAYKVIDPATQPKRRYSPRRSLIVIISTLVGGLFASLFVLLRHGYRARAK